MPRKLPDFGLQFGAAVDRTLTLAEAGELIRAGSPPASVGRRELPVSRLEAIYEIAYLRIFLLWEDFLEQTFLRYMCGFARPTYVPTLVNAKQKNISDAETVILGGRDFVPWAHPSYVVKRSRAHFVGGLHETVLASNFARLDAFNAVRNRIAHRSEFARLQFDAATISLVGHRYPASSAGRFLRDAVVGAPVPGPWIRAIAQEIKYLALQVCP